MHDAGRLKLVADVALKSGDRVLLVKYKDTRKYDQQTGWFLPDDYMGRLEHPEDAALRILKEQVGVEVPSLDLRFVESFEGGGEAWHLVFHFSGSIPKSSKIKPGPNTAIAEWFASNGLPRREDVAHEGWAIDVLEAMSKPRSESAHIRSVVT